MTKVITPMSKKDRNEQILKSLLEGKKRDAVAAEFGVTDEKLTKIVMKQMEKAAALGLTLNVAAEPVVIEEPAIAKPTTRKAVPKNPSRLNPEVTERLKVQAIKEAQLLRNLTDRADALRKRRNDTIRTLCDRGLTEREVGELVGMSGPRINQIYFGTNGSRS